MLNVVSGNMIDLDSYLCHSLVLWHCSRYFVHPFVQLLNNVMHLIVMMMKTEIVQALRNLEKPFPFEMVWSCYHGGESTGGKMCGKCESCQRFMRATGIKL